jgi:septal ring factor EnvC (AmiA/AmiB activator)
MLELLARAFAAVGAAFVLGMAVGWLCWRFGRRTMTQAEWSSGREQVAALEQRLRTVDREHDALAGQVRALREEAARLQSALTLAWQQRDELHGQLVAFDAELAGFRDEFERVLAQRRHLQRRVTELSLAAARDSTIDLDRQTVPAAPTGSAPSLEQAELARANGPAPALIRPEDAPG